MNLEGLQEAEAFNSSQSMDFGEEGAGCSPFCC